MIRFTASLIGGLGLAMALTSHGAVGELTAAQVLSHVHSVTEMEIRAGQLAVKRADTPAVRQYGLHLIADYKQADREVRYLAGRKKIALTAYEPVEQDEKNFDAKQRQRLRQLGTLSGPAFDRQFLEAMAAGHAETARRLSESKMMLKDYKTRSLLTRIIPEVLEHEKIAGDLQDKNHYFAE